jgi:2-keto-3-deoxy-L-rhamnonate aldolase RhmA
VRLIRRLCGYDLDCADELRAIGGCEKNPSTAVDFVENTTKIFLRFFDRERRHEANGGAVFDAVHQYPRQCVKLLLYLVCAKRSDLDHFRSVTGKKLILIRSFFMYQNKVKQALREGRVQIGTGFWQLRSPEIARLLAAAGFDWAFLDSEHGGFDLETLQDLSRVARLAGLTPIVRVGSLDYALVARALDCGAAGIIFPRVEDPELLARAVSWTKFPSEGIRGYGLAMHQLDYETRSFSDVIEHVNANTLVILQIETKRALEAREELLSVPGIDAVMVGPADLSISLGVPGEFEHQSLVDAMLAVRDSCIAHGVAPGTHTRNLKLAQFWRENGMRFLGCGNELAMLWERANEIARALRA